MAPCSTYRHVRRGFTLVDLLVVIAIFAILAAILFPVFAQARESARMTTSLSNEKQIETGIGMYAQDYDGKLSPDPFPRYMPPVSARSLYAVAHIRRRAFCAGDNVTYHGGTGGIGVETAPKIYLILWGSQWNNNDPSGEAAILEAFYKAVGGSSWNNVVTQYCQGVDEGTEFCNGSGKPAGNPSDMFAKHWYDNASPAPTHPTQSQFAAEAVRAARFFGNTTAASNASVQYVIATSHGNNADGFGTEFCAYHSSTGGSFGDVAYTNLPYMTDAGAGCGADLKGLGPNAGITMVGGHELAEAETDQFFSSGWVDSSGAEIADKCTWITSGQGASAKVKFPNGSSFPVQSLWSNAFNGGAGGCVLSYP